MILPHILSLGAGVQSSTLALRAAYGDVLPNLTAAIFADTQAEPAVVYKWLDYLEAEVAKAPFPYPIYRVTKGNLTEHALKVHHVQSDGCKLPKGTAYLNKLLPIFGLDTATGKRTAALGRKCTFDFKIRPVLKKLRAIVRPKRGQATPAVVQWIGISADEASRMKDPREPWIAHRWPLVELGMTRADCLAWVKARGFQEPPRSACYYCPFHSDDEWLRVKADPASWEQAIAFDHELRSKFRDVDKSLGMEVYLHESCKPLAEVKFNGAGDRAWINECEGMCGV
jgi:hypothetical protein